MTKCVLQTSNFVTRTTGGVTGYEAIDVDADKGFIGLERNTNYGGSHSLADGNGGSNWWYALGVNHMYKGGYPGANPHITKHVELWARLGTATAQTQSNKPFTAKANFAYKMVVPRSDMHRIVPALKKTLCVGSSSCHTFKKQLADNLVQNGLDVKNNVIHC